jgi:hypothetical protein
MMFWGCSFESKTPEVTPYVIEGVSNALDHLVDGEAGSYLSLYPVHKALYGSLWFRVQTGDDTCIGKPNKEAFPEGESGATVTV